MAEPSWKYPHGDVLPGRRHLRCDQRGVVYVEFVIAFVPMFIFFLGLIQLSLMYSGQMVVAAAARKAARTAIVFIDNEKTCLAGGSRTQKNPFMDSGGSGASPEMSGNEVMDKVRSSAYLPLSVLAPNLKSYPFVGDALGVAGVAGQQTARMVAGYFLYSRGAAAVTFRDPNGEVIEPPEIRDALGGDNPVVVQVSYVFPCIIPIARRIMCKPLYDMVGLADAAGRAVKRLEEDVRGITDVNELLDNHRDHWDDLDSNPQDYWRAIGATVREAQDTAQGAADGVRDTIDGIQQSVDELDDKVEEAKAVYEEMGRAEYPALMAPWVFSPIRFAIFKAQAQLPNQWATYSQARLEKDGCGGDDG